MAICHRKLKQWNEAVACDMEGVELFRTLHGNLHPEYATMLYNLAEVFSDLKQYEEAIPQLEEVLTIRRRVYVISMSSLLYVCMYDVCMSVCVMLCMCVRAVTVTFWYLEQNLISPLSLSLSLSLSPV
jgi:tetratricopeptide (TPR) repeat protein